jgi:hypothetical protein
MEIASCRAEILHVIIFLGISAALRVRPCTSSTCREDQAIKVLCYVDNSQQLYCADVKIESRSFASGSNHWYECIACWTSKLAKLTATAPW